MTTPEGLVALAYVWVVSVGTGEQERFRLFLDRAEAEAVQDQARGARLLEFHVYVAWGGGLDTSNILPPRQIRRKTREELSDG